MKFTVSSTVIFNRLQVISRVINSKNSLPILDCILIELKDGTLLLTASDKETTLSTSIVVNEPDGEGQIAISSKTLLDALREISEQPLSFDINLDTLEVKISYMNGRYNLVGQNADEYPLTLPFSGDTTILNIPADVLLSGLNRTSFATADDEIHPVMNGIYLDITPEDITIAATDGHKLVRCHTVAAKGNEKSSLILAKKPVNMLRNFLPKEEGGVELRFDNRNAVMVSQNYTMICRLIEGRYPNYNSVIPKNNPNRATVDRASFISALKRVSVFSSQVSSLVKLSMDYNRIKVSAQDIDFSTSAEETIECLYDGATMDIGFKANFFIDILNNISSDSVILELADPSRAGVIVPESQGENEDLLMLLMPMMVND